MAAAVNVLVMVLMRVPVIVMGMNLMKMGIVDWDYLHPSLKPILHETHDVCAFQENFSKWYRTVGVCDSL